MKKLYVVDSISKYRLYLDKSLTVSVDRPMGVRHPRFDTVYELNYGYIDGTVAGDGMEIDAYIIGPKGPVDVFRGVCVALLVRRDDNEHKLVVANHRLTETEIKNKTHFIERFFNSYVVLAG